MQGIARLTWVLALAALLTCAHGQRFFGLGFCLNIPPGSPRALEAVGGNGRIDITWAAPFGNRCVDGYVVTGQRADGIGKMATFNTTVTAGYITNVANGVVYNITVQAFSSRSMGGVAATSVAPNGSPSKPDPRADSPADSPWTCTGFQDTYPTCPAASTGLCEPLPCARMAALGMCDAPFMRTADWGNQTIIQHCAKECGCPTTPSLRTTLAAPAPDYCCRITVGDYFIQSD